MGGQAGKDMYIKTHKILFSVSLKHDSYPMVTGEAVRTLKTLI